MIKIKKYIFSKIEYNINRINLGCNCLVNIASTGQKYIIYNPLILYYGMYKYDIIDIVILIKSIKNNYEYIIVLEI